MRTHIFHFTGKFSTSQYQIAQRSWLQLLNTYNSLHGVTRCSVTNCSCLAAEMWPYCEYSHGVNMVPNSPEILVATTKYLELLECCNLMQCLNCSCVAGEMWPYCEVCVNISMVSSPFSSTSSNLHDWDLIVSLTSQNGLSVQAAKLERHNVHLRSRF